MVKTQDSPNGKDGAAMNRREIFKSAAAMSVPACTIAGLASLPTLDPVFAAIERHKIADAVFKDACNHTHENGASSPEDMEAWLAADAAAWAARTDLMGKVPITVAGLRAFLLYVREIDWEGDDMDAAVDIVLASPVLMEG
jgi:hypothetical protein